MKIGIATDHNGVNEKMVLIEYLKNLGYEVFDLSENNTPTDDYPDFAEILCKKINSNDIELGILMCGTGIGMSIAANKIKGIRCAHVSNESEASLAREHNNANVIALSYKEDIEKLKKLIKIFIETPFSNEERHIRRINKIKELENN